MLSLLVGVSDTLKDRSWGVVRTAMGIVILAEVAPFGMRKSRVEGDPKSVRTAAVSLTVDTRNASAREAGSAYCRVTTAVAPGATGADGPTSVASGS